MASEGTIQDWTSGPPVIRPKDIGQQVVREVDDYFGYYLYLPRTVARIHLNAVYKELGGAEEAYPPAVSQDVAHMIQVGATSEHGGSGGFFYLLKRGQYCIDPTFLVPLLVGTVKDMADLDPAGLLYSQWEPFRARNIEVSMSQAFIGISHWIWPGAAVISAQDALYLIQNPTSEPSQGKLKEIRRKITAA